MPKEPHKLADSYRIIALKAENFLRLKAVQIAFDPKAHTAILSGENGEGKTSVIQAIWTALGGAKVTPREPVHEGAEQAEITLDLAPEDDACPESLRRIRVTRTVTVEGGWGLKIWTPDKGSFPSPQTILDAFFNTLTFDPSEFIRMKPEGRSRVLIDMAGVKAPIDALKQKRQIVYDQRTDVNRDLKSAESRLEALPMPGKDAPALVSLTELSQDLEAARALKKAHDAKRQELQDLRQAHVTAKAEVKRLEEELEAARTRVTELVETGRDLKAEVDALVDPKLQDLETQLATAEETNEKARGAQRYREEETSVKGLQKESADLTTRIDAVDDEISQVILSAHFPIDGLSITDEGQVTYKDRPFEQASDAQRLEVSLAMGAAMHPKLKFLALREASMMTEKTRARVSEWAAEHGVLVLMELATSEEIGIHIVDGEVASAN
ncbi:MAG: AAA family ATPase [bacterium]|nr:AAA family ATPase [bacterium]